MRKEKRRKIITAVIAVILVVMLVLPLALSAVYAASGSEKAGESVTSSSSDDGEIESAEKIPVSDPSVTCIKGVYIDTVDVAGMNRQELEEAIADRMEQLNQQKITLTAGKKSVKVSAEKLGLSYTNDNIADEALNIGNRGNVLKRFYAEQYRKENGAIVLKLRLTADDTKIRQTIQSSLNRLNSDPVDAEITVTNGMPVVSRSQDGISVDVEKSVRAVKNYIASTWDGEAGKIGLVCDTVKASGDSRQLADVKDTLGQVTTEYDISDTARTANLKNAVSKISGTIVYPNETFDFMQTVGSLSAANGFSAADSYETGETEDAVGGGICQASTTLYEAALQAELEIQERNSCTEITDYAEPSMDAAVDDDGKDLSFQNNTDAPVLLYAEMNGGKLTVTIFGKEYRDSGRSISFESRTEEKTAYTVSFQYTQDEPLGYLETTGGRDGMTAQAWKIIEEEGSDRQEEQVNTSEYQMVPMVYTIGTNGATAEELYAVYEAVRNEDVEALRSAIGG